MRKIVLRVDRKHSALENAAIILDQGKQQMIFILLFTVLYLFRDLGGANVPDIVFTGLCAVAFILTDMGTCLGMYIFTTALTVPHNEIRIAYLAIILVKMISSGVVQINGRMLMYTISMIFLQMLNVTLFSTNSADDVFYNLVVKMLSITLPLIWFNDEYSAEDFKSALMCYVVGALLGGTVTMILTAEHRSWEALLKGTGGKRLGATYSTDGSMQTTYNANQLSIMFAITVAILIGVLDRKQMSPLLCIALLGYCLFMILLTRSRTGLLMTALAILVYIMVMIIRRRKILLGSFILVLIVALVAALFYFFPELTQRFLDRFVDQEDITNGRVDIAAYFLYKWIETPWCFLFGYGIGSFFEELDVRVSPHNSITDILISWGLVGLFLVVGVLAMCWRRGIKSVAKKIRIIAILPALVALIASMAGQYLTSGSPHMRLCFLLLAAKAFAAEEKKKCAQCDENTTMV